jgi:hypothetical protein
MEVCERLEQVGAGSTDDLHQVDQLISDLAALLDAGLLVVHETVLGPPRYGVGAEPGDRRVVQLGAQRGRDG